MPYVTTVERAGIEKGMQQGEAAVLRRLLEWSERVLTAATPNAVFADAQD